ncbi:histidine kinase [Methylotenera sp.]|uniref:histidine kinase n=1 Tax=Methylotenera sp. TaxID=2051956 RepID=UPI0027311232|nr:histidine kinase [Methylotenera sp.]MDP2229494.1 histidine kinase [Methylotenera sp.]MDP3142190.1 histidine kinase [Methylotenera sp.]
MSLQLKLNLMITCLLLVLLSVSAFFVVKNASEDVRAEVTSTANLALHLLDAEILHYSSDFGWINNGDGASIFRLKELGNIRHLKIEFYDINGKLRETNRNKKQALEDNAPPKWFVNAMSLTGAEMQKQTRNIILSGRYVGELVVTPDPSYEIAEVWNDTVGLLGLAALFFVLINVLVYFAVKHTFKPVNRILDALTQMEQGRFSSRLPDFKQVELDAIGKKFNSMADTLQSSTQNNHRLTQQIIRLQEDERKSLARDIHDEIGQYLTAIHVDASAILNGKKLSVAKESAQAISSVTRQMMDMVHEILQRLRPRALDELGLSLALGELIHHWRQRCRNVNIIQNIVSNIGPIDEAVSITAYRVVQECLTNIAKHANAHRVTINVRQDAQYLYLHIEDDGVGFDPTITAQGFGLAGMNERIQGLMGEMKIESSKKSDTGNPDLVSQVAISQGTRIMIKLPKQARMTESVA